MNDKIEEYLKRFSQFKEYLCDNPSEITNGGELLKSFIYNKMSENCIEYLRKCKDEDKTISEGTKRIISLHLIILKDSVPKIMQ